MRSCRKPLQRGFAFATALAAALALAACRTTTGAGATDAAAPAAEGWECLAFRPIGWSSRDTGPTIAEIREHNAAWEAVCATLR